LRSLYSVYQLQVAPEQSSGSAPATMVSAPKNDAELVLCEIFPAPPAPKRKSTT